MSEPSHSSEAPACAQTPSPLTLFFGGGEGGLGTEGGVCAQATGALACEQQTHFRSSPLSLRKVAIFQRERSDDRKYVYCSQATGARTLSTFNFIFSLLKSLLLGRCSGGTILGSPSHLSSLSPFPSGEPAHGLSSKLFETFNWIVMRSGENYFDKKTAKLS